MTVREIAAVAVTIGLNALDGFDVLAISFASPGIAAEWHIDRAALGVVLSMELVGMAIGSFVLGSVADRIGRRPTILGCLGLMTLGMFMAGHVHGLDALLTWRVVTGLGIGGVLASINAVAAEFSSPRRRHLSVSLMSIGYPIGAVVGGTVAAHLLASGSWRSVFLFGAATTAVFIPIVVLLVPESPSWAHRRDRHSMGEVFKPALLPTTLLLTFAYFFHVTTFYFVLKWIPKLVVDMGFAASAAAGVLVWTNVGGATGGAVFALATQRVSLRALTVGTMLGSTAAMIVFGRTPPDLQALSLICAAAGFFTNAGIVGMYALFAQAFPTHARASGTGVAIGVGRGGAVLAPILAGVLFQAGMGLPLVALVMSTGSLLAAGAVTLLRTDKRRQQDRFWEPRPASSRRNKRQTQ